MSYGCPELLDGIAQILEHEANNMRKQIEIPNEIITPIKTKIMGLKSDKNSLQVYFLDLNSKFCKISEFLVSRLQTFESFID